MKVVRLAFSVLLMCSSGFAQIKVGAKLPDRVAAVLGVQASAALGTPDYDEALLRRLQSIGGLKEVFGDICARAQSDELIVRAEWHAMSLHVWFGAFEDGERVECDIDMMFSRSDKVTAVTTWVTREAAAAQPETVRAFVSRIELPPPTQKETEPNQPPQRNAGGRPSSDDSSASETPSSLGPRG